VPHQTLWKNALKPARSSDNTYSRGQHIGLIHNSKSGGESGDGEESKSLQGNADHQDHRMRQTVPLSSSVDYVNWYHSCVRYPVVQCVALLFVRFSSSCALRPMVSQEATEAGASTGIALHPYGRTTHALPAGDPVEGCDVAMTLT
jgi:hypothetical protein